MTLNPATLLTTSAAYRGLFHVSVLDSVPNTTPCCLRFQIAMATGKGSCRLPSRPSTFLSGLTIALPSRKDYFWPLTISMLVVPRTWNTPLAPSWPIHLGRTITTATNRLSRIKHRGRGGQGKDHHPFVVSPAPGRGGIRELDFVRRGQDRF